MANAILITITAVAAAGGLAASILWVLRRRVAWAVRHTRYGDVDQRWLVPIVVFVDGIYAVFGLVTLASAGFWVGEACIVVVQVVLVAAWLGFLFVSSRRRAA